MADNPPVLPDRVCHRCKGVGTIPRGQLVTGTQLVDLLADHWRPGGGCNCSGWLSHPPGVDKIVLDGIYEWNTQGTFPSWLHVQ